MRLGRLGLSEWSSWIYILFFVFKQKTAYEMRISDWSSDVCSSDLENQISSGDKTYHLDKFFFTIATQNPIEMEGTYPLPAAQLDRFFMKTSFGYVTEIGRASCRERVCQYV